MGATGNLNADMKLIADSIGKYIMATYVEPRLAKSVSYYRAQVVTPLNSAGKIEVRRPYDETTLLLPCTGSAETLVAGEQCLVFVLGDASNSVIVGDGLLKNL